jgi:uncharacterized protein (TIRG00374 family)
MSGTGRSRFRWILPLLRYGLCAVAIIWLVFNVPWHDRVRLYDADGPWVRLIERQDGHFVVERDGRRETIPADQVHHVEIEGRPEPAIELGMPGVVRQADALRALWAVLMFVPVVALQCTRLVVMLAIQDVRLSLWSATKLTFVGNFFNFALPGTTGGDWIKAYYVTRYTHRKTEAFTTIFLDRAMGLVGIITVAVTAILLSWDPNRFGGLVATLGLLVAALAVGAAVVFTPRLREVLRLRDLAMRLPMGEQLLRIGGATVAIGRHKLLAVTALALTLSLQLIAIAGAAVMGWALDMHARPLEYFIYVAIGFMIAAIPIAPPQGLGVMEFAYVQFFTQGGLNTASQAVALALAVRLIQLVWALPGVLVPLLGAHLPSKTELAELEAAASSEPEAAVQGGNAGRGAASRAPASAHAASMAAGE